MVWVGCGVICVGIEEVGDVCWVVFFFFFCFFCDILLLLNSVVIMDILQRL